MIALSAKKESSFSMEMHRIRAMGLFQALQNVKIKLKYPRDGKSEYLQKYALHIHFWITIFCPKNVQSKSFCRIRSIRKFDPLYSVRNNLSSWLIFLVIPTALIFV